jgi:hypothetical protein
MDMAARQRAAAIKRNDMKTKTKLCRIALSAAALSRELTMKRIVNRTHLAVLVTALCTVGYLPTRVEAGPSPDLVNSILRSREQAAKVPKGETVAMVCAKCQTVLLSKVERKKGFLGWFQPRAKHECPGCGGEFLMKDVPGWPGRQIVGVRIRSHFQQVWR